MQPCKKRARASEPTAHLNSCKNMAVITTIPYVSNSHTMRSVAARPKFSMIRIDRLARQNRSFSAGRPGNQLAVCIGAVVRRKSACLGFDRDSPAAKSVALVPLEVDGLETRGVAYVGHKRIQS